MFKTCPVSTLRAHSAGKKYAAVQIGFEWQLQTELGDVLCGYRGKNYAFESKSKASVWLCTNLSRVKNAKENVSDDRISMIGKIYLETGDYFALQEIHDIWDLNNDLWQPIECAGITEYITIEASIDYDGGDASGIVTN